MSVEINHILSAREIQDLIVHVSSFFSKGQITQSIHPYLCGDENNSRLPFSYALEKGILAPEFVTSSVNYTFQGILRPQQVEIIKQAFGFLATKNRILLATHVGFGKTLLAIYILSQLKLKTFIVVNRTGLMDQWKDELNKFLNAPRVYTLSAGKVLDYKKFDIFIINAVNIPKIRQNLFPVGLLIVDEAHLILSPKMCQNLLYFTPKYLVGLTATPYRSDGSNKLFELFFGATVIFKPLLAPHFVYKVLTGFEPEIQKTARGKINWDKMLLQQAQSSERNQLIVNIVKKYSDLKFIILCKRVGQIQALTILFAREKIPVESVHGNSRVDAGRLSEARALIGTVLKLGVGFNEKSLTGLILAGDVQEYFIQYLGRVFRNPSVEPAIFDLVDENYSLKKHYESRERVYREVGLKQLIILDKYLEPINCILGERLMSK